MCGHSNVQFPFCSFCTGHSLPVAYFLPLVLSSVPLTELYKATAYETHPAFSPSRFHQTLHQGEEQWPPGSQAAWGAMVMG